MLHGRVVLVQKPGYGRARIQNVALRRFAYKFAVKALMDASIGAISDLSSSEA